VCGASRRGDLTRARRCTSSSHARGPAAARRLA
jgi:hypothetical protein